jgi:hypothetical protein
MQYLHVGISKYIHNKLTELVTYPLYKLSVNIDYHLKQKYSHHVMF